MQISCKRKMEYFDNINSWYYFLTIESNKINEKGIKNLTKAWWKCLSRVNLSSSLSIKISTMWAIEDASGWSGLDGTLWPT